MGILRQKAWLRAALDWSQYNYFRSYWQNVLSSIRNSLRHHWLPRFKISRLISDNLCILWRQRIWWTWWVWNWRSHFGRSRSRQLLPRKYRLWRWLWNPWEIHVLDLVSSLSSYGFLSAVSQVDKLRLDYPYVGRGNYFSVYPILCY